MENTELIEKYLDGSLTEQEKAGVETRAASDEEFRKLIQLHREVNESIADSDLYDLHRKLERLAPLREPYLKPNTGKGRFISFLRIAALFILVAGSVIVLRYVVFKPSLENRLYARHYVTYDADAITRSGSSAKDAFKDAIEKYSKKDYIKAFTEFSDIVIIDPDNNHAWFFRGLASMELKDFENAADSFSRIPQEWISPYSEHRDWYFALSLLKLQRTSEAGAIFKRIIAHEGYYMSRASEIYSKISR
jgi:tetratricopeptide (TPR) repeat protein